MTDEEIKENSSKFDEPVQDLMAEVTKNKLSKLIDELFLVPQKIPKIYVITENGNCLIPIKNADRNYSICIFPDCIIRIMEVPEMDKPIISKIDDLTEMLLVMFLDYCLDCSEVKGHTLNDLFDKKKWDGIIAPYVDENDKDFLKGFDEDNEDNKNNK